MPESKTKIIDEIASSAMTSVIEAMAKLPDAEMYKIIYGDYANYILFCTKMGIDPIEGKKLLLKQQNNKMKGYWKK